MYFVYFCHLLIINQIDINQNRCRWPIFFISIFHSAGFTLHVCKFSNKNIEYIYHAGITLTLHNSCLNFWLKSEIRLKSETAPHPRLSSHYHEGKARQRGRLRTSIVWSVPHVLSVPPVNYILNYDGFHVEIIVPGTPKSMWTLIRRIMQLHQIIQNNFF